MILVHFHQRMRIDVSGWQDLIGWAVYIFVEQKSWGTFAFLFGVGFAILLRRLESRRQPVVAIYLRRLAALAFFGIVADVFFGFQILFTYACWGAGLLIVRHWSDRALIATAFVSVIARPAATLGMATWAWAHSLPFPANPATALAAAAKAAAQQDRYLPLLAARWDVFITFPGWRALLPDTNFALFIVGLLAVRRGIFDKPLEHVRTIRVWMAMGAVSWLLAWTVAPLLPAVRIPGAQWPVISALGLIEDQWLCFFYIGAMVLLLAKWPLWQRRLRPIGQAGRMALSNYMLQAAALDVLASGYGVGLRLTPAAYVVATIAFFGAEVALSMAWLSRHRLGPLEWCWRVVTYWRRE